MLNFEKNVSSQQYNSSNTKYIMCTKKKKKGFTRGSNTRDLIPIQYTLMVEINHSPDPQLSPFVSYLFHELKYEQKGERRETKRRERLVHGSTPSRSVSFLQLFIAINENEKEEGGSVWLLQ